MAISLLSRCLPDTFAAPSLFGAQILSIHASPVTNFTVNVPSAYRFTQPSIYAENISFCNVTLTYTHTGTPDTVNVEIWLPENEVWNQRLYSVGGGGFTAGRFSLSYMGMAGALAEGYATSTTDAGLGAYADPQDASSWALLSPGNVDYNQIRNLGSVSLNDQAIISKDIILSFYGSPPMYSYWNGCSQGGRQGLMLAQRYPTAYDGIAAGAPALEFPKLGASIFWPQQVMNMLGEYPHMCELDAIAQAAVAACDELDGVADGIVSDVNGCLSSFDPFKLVGTPVNCSKAGHEVLISPAAATVVSATWRGLTTALGRRIYPGVSPGADLTGSQSYQPGIAVTNCSGDTCVGQPNTLGSQWLQLFVAKDPSFDIGNLTHEEFDALVRAGNHEYEYLLGTNDADLSRFRDAGGKMLMFHGLDDNIIPAKSTETYYKSVASLLPDIHSFYRYFEVPGLAHCYGGAGGQPTALFEQLRAWVENGTAPDSSPIEFTDAKGVGWSRILCPFPQRAKFRADCGEATAARCWACVENEVRQSRSLSNEL